MYRSWKTVAIVAAIVLGVTACGSKPKSNEGNSPSSGGPSSTQTSTPPASNASFKACMVSDSGGFDDKSFNQTSYKGLTDAVAKLGVSHAELESHTNADYADNIAAMVQQKCNIIVTVGFLLADATLKAAKANPDIDFAIVDNAFKPGEAPANLKSLTFNTAQPSYLAGYLAAGMTKTGVVGTFGGLNIPTVTVYMDGFWEGVQAYNKDNGKDVKVVGWSEKTQQGTFTNDFEDKNKGQVVAQNLTAAGADILFPVAGPAGLGALQTAKDSGGSVNAIWVDTDGCVSAAEYCGTLETSVEKGMDVAVETAIEDALNGTFTSQPYIGTLNNGGVALAPYHDFDGTIPSALKTKIASLKTQIMDGTITIMSKAQP